MVEETKLPAKTLEAEIRDFVNNLPYWSKFIASKILCGKLISEEDVGISYSYLLEELKIKDKTKHPEITISSFGEQQPAYSTNLIFSRLENVEGVNALEEGYKIEFCGNLTIIYGANGSGKSGYTRLLKKKFYSKAQEEIIENIYSEGTPKKVSADFIFNSIDKEIPIPYSNMNHPFFEQFAVFDGKSATTHLENKNEFDFKPAGLSFFGTFSKQLIRVEQKLADEIKSKKQQGSNLENLLLIFDGESETKNAIRNIDSEKGLEFLFKLTPFLEEDKLLKENIQKQYEELLIASKNKGNKINDLKKIKTLLINTKQKIERINNSVSSEMIEIAKTTMTDYLQKVEVAKSEGIKNFQNDRIQKIGGKEWKNFISSAAAFARIQDHESSHYPDEGDNCLFCHQSLSESSKILIQNYWKFIESQVEQEANELREKLTKAKKFYNELNFDLFPPNNVLTLWLNEKYPIELEKMKEALVEQHELTRKISDDIKNEVIETRIEIKVDTSCFEDINLDIDNLINFLEKDEQTKKLDELLKLKLNLEHKERLNIHFSKFKEYIQNKEWVKKAEKNNFGTQRQKITRTEKILSEKYFSQKYIDIFNKECEKLDGNFGIQVNHTGSAGKSYRQLKIKGKNPKVILSEGEQKVIATADFLAETTLSDINKGIVFDDPVTSLDDKRKTKIVNRLVEEAKNKQVIIFTHDLIFVSSLLTKASQMQIETMCHWIEARDGKPGQIFLNNSPSYEKEYRNDEPVMKHYNRCKDTSCEPSVREMEIRQGFTALRTCYEVLVINELFCNVVQRYNERVSIDSLAKVAVSDDLIEEILDCYGGCCRYMEGHTHSDAYAYEKPEPKNLQEEIERYNMLRKKIKQIKKEKLKAK